MSRLTPNSLRLRLVLAVGAVAICSLLVLRYHYRLTIVVGGSMRPTLNSGDLLVVDKNAYQSAEPSRGDIVVARYRNEFVVKRIVALPGEEVEVKLGVLYINGSPEPENHKVEPGSLDIGKGKLLEGDFATLGDNRSVPRDQAVHPIVSKKDIVGRVKLSFGL